MDSIKNPILAAKLHYMHFNPAMKRIADILITDTPGLLNCSIGDIAKKSSVSTASVTRFVQILGYKNFKAFRQSLQEYLLGRQEAVPGTTGFQNDNSAKKAEPSTPESICHYVIESEIEMLKDTLSLMDFSTMDLVARKICQARHVIFLGEGRSFIAAQSACNRFDRLGILCSCYGDSHSMLPAIVMTEPSDLVVGISNYGHSKPVVNCIKYAKEHNIPTVAITSSQDSPLSTLADNLIITGFNYNNLANQDEIICYEPTSENLPQFSVIDCLYLIAGNMQDKDCVNRYYECTRLIDAERI